MIYGLEILERGLAGQIAEKCFENGLVIELAGADDQVVKFLPALTIDEETLLRGIAIVDQSIASILQEKRDNLTGAM